MVVASSLSERFVALSYVWGEPSEEPQSQWPQTVLDAVEATKQLGFGYLWVDRYCIDQTNAAEKHSQISNMDSIYGMAEVTIIAAAGDGAARSLPGVGTDRVVPMRASARWAEYFTVPETDVDFLGSTWFGRGWTYQEGVLSRRRLIFTEYQVTFECSSMLRYESFQFNLDHLRIIQPDLLRDVIRNPVLGLTNGWQVDGKPDIEQHRPLPRPERLRQRTKAQGANGINLDDHIRRYCNRQLSFPSDWLNAFLGVLRFSQMHSYFGLEVAHADFNTHFAVSLLYWHRYDASQVVEIQKKNTANGTLTQRIGRVKELPSWSWVGWSGPVQLASRKDFANSTYRPIITLRTNEGKVLTPQVMASLFTRQDDWAAALSRCIWIEKVERLSYLHKPEAVLTVTSFDLSTNTICLGLKFLLRHLELRISLCGAQIVPGELLEYLKSGRLRVFRLLDD